MADEMKQQEVPEEDTVQQPTTLLGLWRAHQVEIAIIKYPVGVEELAIWASVTGDQSSREVQRIWRMMADQKPIGKLEMTTRTLWALDLGTEWYPVYAEDEQIAEHIAQLVEQGRGLKRRSFVQAPGGRGIYAGQITVMGHSIERLPLTWEKGKLY